MRAVIELIWNSLDADANKVTVTLDRNVADGIVGVAVRDDGLGMSPERVEQDFKWVGNSWKLGARFTERENRPLHGRLGQGRLRAFALGTRVTWETVGQDATGAFKKTRLSSTIDNRNDFTGPDPVDAQGPTYTEFRAEGRDSLGRLEGDAARPRIGGALALHLLTFPTIEVRYDGVKIDPAASIERETLRDLSWSYGGVERRATLRVVEWREVKGRALYLCDEQGLPIEETPIRRFADFNFAAYVLWGDMAEHANEAMLVDLEQETSLLGSLMQVAEA
ncbi:ATP-binding protein [Microcella flavibacter]|uniref:ATP-binding protein n=1 Tax=Microcella flavibacter TaxID=1804990 RepID=UPI001456A387|nr:ATP-binding protein [Microcella flavibacter]